MKLSGFLKKQLFFLKSNTIIKHPQTTNHHLKLLLLHDKKHFFINATCINLQLETNNNLY